MNENESPLNTVNQHYLDKVLDLAKTEDVSASEDIFDSRDMKLIAKGSKLSASMQEKLIARKLRKPLETCIEVEAGVNIDSVMAEAKRLVEAVESIGHIFGSADRGMSSPFDILGRCQLGSVMGMMLTIADRGGDAAITHTVLVSLLSICLANKLGISEKEQSTLAMAGLLHDIGELYIDPKFMRPQKRLLPYEWRHVIVHPRIGKMIIKELGTYPETVANAVAEHHERFDGTGYPGRIAGKNISIAGQILSVSEMISVMLVQKDNPLERAELALRLIPNEHSYELVSAVSSILRRSKRTTSTYSSTMQNSARERAKVQFEHISLVIETSGKMVELERLQSASSKSLLTQTLKRINAIHRAYTSTGLDACAIEDTSVSSEVLFEAIVATREIQWRLRDVARDLSMRASELDIIEAEAFLPLVGMLDAEPTAKSLPSQNPSAASETPSQTADSVENAPRKRTLLLVDDEPNMLKSLVRMLHPFNYNILTAPDGLAALEVLSKSEVSIVLSDHRMPNMTGIELLSRVKTMYPKTVRMILSGYADGNTVNDAIKLGAIYKFLTKPWDQSELCTALEEAFQKYEKSVS